MATTLRSILDGYRAGSKTEREKGGYFERLTKVWLESAPTQRDQFLRVLTFADWAKERREDQRDTGIDLCAQLADDPESWCAIQCKFYAHGYRLQKGDIDSFFTASGRRPFTRRIIVDTTDAAWSEHAETALNDQIVPTSRIGLNDLEESGIDWGTFAAEGVVQLEPKKRIRPHQQEALNDVLAGLTDADRGKMIMACGTGKTFTALKIAESMAGKNGHVLYLVPSLALMSQTVREWSIDSETPLRSFAVCSDAQVGVRRARNEDVADIDVHDLEIPATTLPSKLGANASQPASDRMTVVFSTYQSIQVISEAQKKYGLPEFDLIVCDEAHRTTGVTLSGDDESNFVRIHRSDYIAGKKRLYMTATPRIYGEGVQATAREVDAALCSMDDTALFGETLFTRNFSWAVQNGLLTDYKVIVLAVDEGAVSASVQRRLSDENSELLLDDATKIIGCYRALMKADLIADVSGDTGPMHRALAFTRDIKSSKLFRTEFVRVAEEWRAHFEAENPDAPLPVLHCEVDHVDGTFNATARGQRLSWLKSATQSDTTCRILSNARCLSEGVDVPALDAIMFLHPRKSQIDVVQSVGRVMRKAEGKRMGYVILPVGVPAGVPPEQALDDNEKYKVVWQILNALRAHDDRLDATINKIDYGADPGDRIEVVAVSNQMPNRAKAAKDGLGLGRGGGAGDLDPGETLQDRAAEQLAFQFDDFAKAILSRIVKKCGTRTYWEDWANDVADIARKHVTRLTVAVAQAGSEEQVAFEKFLAEIQDDLNDSITAEEAIEMLAQHMITRPVFDALFENYQFAASNPVSQALQGVLDVLNKQNLDKETDSLERFYASVRLRAAGIEDAAAKQRIVKELYDRFFKAAFPSLAQRMGIVYTPIEIVDFIIKSVDETLRAEFKQTLGSAGVHIIDPFTGTGTFVTRLLQSGLIKPDELPHKYNNEIHANEILLLAYYIGAINIEAAYHELSNGAYAPFPGICLTDTFQLYEKDDLVSALMSDNSSRRSKQKKLPIQVIIGNPPYSAGQRSENDNAANVQYRNLDERIRETYAAASAGVLQKGLYDSYIRAIRWGSERLRDSGGVMAYVSGSAWIERAFADGMRKCLAEDFSSIYVVRLRGDIRKNMLSKGRAREGENVFGSASMTGIAITLFVNDKRAKQRGRIFIHDIGDDLTRDQKIGRIVNYGSAHGISAADGWTEITPDPHGDWIGQRDPAFEVFPPLGDKSASASQALFSNYSLGVVTNRDAWCVNPSSSQMLSNLRAMVETYQSELARFEQSAPSFQSAGQREAFVDSFVTKDSTKISWTRSLKGLLGRKVSVTLSPDRAVTTCYRPFNKQWLYFDRRLNEMVYQMPRIFPHSGVENLVIAVSGTGARAGFSCLMTDAIPSLDTIEKGQCFPLYVYGASGDDDLFSTGENQQPQREYAVTDSGLDRFLRAYPEHTITKEDVFYFVYGLLHSEEYRDRFSDNLSKELPRLPVLKRFEDFKSFTDAGRALADLHVNYERASPYPVSIKEGDFRLANISDPASYFRVEKMKFGGRRGAVDKTTVIYNPRITMENIPIEAYDYVVNGRSALEWVLERQCVKTDPASGIVSDANRYANETVGDPAYPLLLFQRVITVSIETMKIVRALPPLDIAEPASAN